MQAEGWAEWKEHWRRCGSRGKSPSAGAVPGPTSHPHQGGSLEALPRGTVVSQRSHMGGGPRGRGAFRWPLRPRPAPGDPATALGKQLRKSSGNTNPPPQSLPLLWARPLPPSAPRNGAQPKRPASPARFALARPSGHGPRPWGSQHPGLSTHLVAQRLAVPRRTRGIELEPPPSLLATFRLWDVGPRKFQA